MSLKESIVDNIEDSGIKAQEHSKKGYLIIRKLKNEDNDHQYSAVESLELIRQDHDNENLRSLEEHLKNELDEAQKVLGRILRILNKLKQDDKTFNEQDIFTLRDIVEEEEALEDMAERISYEASEEEKNNLNRYKSEDEHEVLKFINSNITKIEHSLDGSRRHIEDMIESYQRLNNL